MSATQCFYGCGRTDDLRPYGPGGEPVCFYCVHGNPDREEVAHRAFDTLFDASAAASPIGVVALADEGPQPFRLGHVEADAEGGQP